MNGKPSLCARREPSVDLPAPRRPIKAMRERRDAESTPPKFFEKKLVGISQLAGRKFLQECSGLLERRCSGLAIRRQSLNGDAKRMGDLMQPANGDVAATEFDLCQETRGQRGFFRELPKRHSTAYANSTELFAELLQIGMHC